MGPALHLFFVLYAFSLLKAGDSIKTQGLLFSAEKTIIHGNLFRWTSVGCHTEKQAMV